MESEHKCNSYLKYCSSAGQKRLLSERIIEHRMLREKCVCVCVFQVMYCDEAQLFTSL